MDCDVIIIGAGLAGLTAACHLKKRQPDLNIRIVEARSRVGGRTYSTEMNVAGGRKAVFDLGASWVGPLHRDLIELMEELGISHLLFPQWLNGKKICWIEPGNIVKYSSELPFYNPFIYLEAYSFMKKVDCFADQLDINNPYLRNPALAEYLDSMTVESMIRQYIHGPELRELIRVGIRTTFGFEARQISALYVVLYGKASGRMENLFTASRDGAQKMRVLGGTYQISQKMAEIIGEKNIMLGAPVTAIEQASDSVAVTISYNEGGSVARLTARRVILAVPPPHILGMKMSPRLPFSIVEVLRAYPMANLFKFTVTYNTAFWREKGLSGEIVCYGGDPNDDCPVGPVSVVYDGCLPDGTPALIGFSAGNQTVYWSKRSFEHRKGAILANLAKMLGEEALKPIDYHEKDWEQEEWTGGCPVACLQPGVGRFFTPSMRLPIGLIHLAGTETAQHSIGYMSGAVQSGRRAAVEVLYTLGKHNPADSSILASTCHGPAGRALRWQVKWPTVNDPCMDALTSKNWIYTIAALVGLGFLIHRRFFRDYNFKFANFAKLWN